MSVCVSACVWMCNVCSCASSSAISQTQILKLFSEKTTIKGETPTIPFLWFFFPFFSPPLIFLILHLFFWPFSRSFIPIFLRCPITFSVSLALPSSPSLFAPAFRLPPSPSCTPWQQEREQKERQWQIDRQCLRRSRGSRTGGGDTDSSGPHTATRWRRWHHMRRQAYTSSNPVTEKPTHITLWNWFYRGGTPLYVCVCVLLSDILHQSLCLFVCWCVCDKQGFIIHFICFEDVFPWKMCMCNYSAMCLHTCLNDVYKHLVMDRYFSLCVFLCVIISDSYYFAV